MNLSITEPSPCPSGDRPECVEYRALWQRRMDGEVGPEANALDRHKESCPACAEFAVLGDLLRAMIRQNSGIIVPDGLSDRVVSAWAGAAPRRRNGRLLAVAAGFVTAASLLFALLSGPSGPTPRGGEVANRASVVHEAKNSETGPEKSVAKKDPSVERKGDDVLDRLPSFDEITTNPLEKLEPMVVVIENIGQDAVSTMSPLANSAKRAADLFWKELTAGQDRPRAN